MKGKKPGKQMHWGEHKNVIMTKQSVV